MNWTSLISAGRLYWEWDPVQGSQQTTDNTLELVWRSHMKLVATDLILSEGSQTLLIVPLDIDNNYIQL